MSAGTTLRRVREGELRDIRVVHRQEDSFCQMCGQIWPCDTRVVLDEVDRLKRLLKEVR